MTMEETQKKMGEMGLRFITNAPMSGDEFIGINPPSEWESTVGEIARSLRTQGYLVEVRKAFDAEGNHLPDMMAIYSNAPPVN